MDIEGLLVEMARFLPGATYESLRNIFERSDGLYLVEVPNGFELSFGLEGGIAWVDRNDVVRYQVATSKESLPALNQDEIREVLTPLMR